MAETCSLDTRRSRLRRSKLNGVDEVEVTGARRTLLVRFFRDAPEGLTNANLCVTGGVAIRDLHVVDVRRVESDDPDIPTQIEAMLDRVGDASTYYLHVVGIDNIDQRYARAPFLFFPEFDDGLDCCDAEAEKPLTPPPPAINYLAKDYGGFRQLMLDRLALTLPDWRENHIPDVGVMIIEMLAYVADRLSYYQDAVATEAYLATARRRISVRRHVRLIDYMMHEGCNARALVQIAPEGDVRINPSTLTFLAGENSRTQFHPMPVADDCMALSPARSAMEAHCWGDSEATLPEGAVSATLVDAAGEDAPSLKPGDFLIFEALTDGRDTSHSDPQSRHAVRLTAVSKDWDALLDKALLQVAWSKEDALPAAFPLNTSKGGATTVVRGNLLLVDHGRSIVDIAGPDVQGSCAEDWRPLFAQLLKSHGGTPIQVAPRGRYKTITLSTPGLGFAEPLAENASAWRVLKQRDPRLARPLIQRLRSWPQRDPSEVAATDWIIRPDLIESGPDDPHAMVEIDDDGAAILRFGDGVCGRDASGQVFEISYRVGNGPSGNVGADRITGLRFTGGHAIVSATIRNPLSASGGTAPEDVEKVKISRAPRVSEFAHARRVGRRL